MQIQPGQPVVAGSSHAKLRSDCYLAVHGAARQLRQEACLGHFGLSFTSCQLRVQSHCLKLPPPSAALPGCRCCQQFPKGTCDDFVTALAAFMVTACILAFASLVFITAATIKTAGPPFRRGTSTSSIVVDFVAAKWTLIGAVFLTFVVVRWAGGLTFAWLGGSLERASLAAQQRSAETVSAWAKHHRCTTARPAALAHIKIHPSERTQSSFYCRSCCTRPLPTASPSSFWCAPCSASSSSSPLFRSGGISLRTSSMTSRCSGPTWAGMPPGATSRQLRTSESADGCRPQLREKGWRNAKTMGWRPVCMCVHS